VKELSFFCFCFEILIMPFFFQMKEPRSERLVNEAYPITFSQILSGKASDERKKQYF
jgi:hypothetical protein